MSLICATVLAFGGCNPLQADGKCQPNGIAYVTRALSGACHKQTLWINCADKLLQLV